MDTITILFTKNKFSIISWLVRFYNFKNNSKISKSSHCLIFDSTTNIAYDSDFSTGVKKGELSELLIGSTIVKSINYTVPNSKAGLQFLEKQVGKKYDLIGSLNIKKQKSRDWTEDDSWYCYELAAFTLRASGLNVFNNLSHINENHLLSLQS